MARDLGSGLHLDEEECLPFPIFTAELELLVGNSVRGKQPDGVQLLELLQKLVVSIPRTERSVLKQHQRQCEAILYDVLSHGIGAAGLNPVDRSAPAVQAEAWTIVQKNAKAVRDAAFRALGELAAASRGPVAAETLSGEKRPAKKTAMERIIGGCVRGCLVTPLVEAAIHGRREALYPSLPYQ
ncbi:hypothetical protein GPECTOR_2g1100 [Gonium pectorale]|uniref:Uncharacterized protein n=1 Tax=Gonium pectorale TaxID=33097 RepID=A0A150H0D8_GONPE|nr:hypothetical protein GPECTOR_2g1100 [Gonium pectorale]|eukprot:KXZ55551.1 hypothetical protein GPECTOR_2g1100 [Gonium pectorale]